MVINRQDLRRELSQATQEIKHLKFSQEGLMLIKYLELKQALSLEALTTAPLDQVQKIQGEWAGFSAALKDLTS